jgi:adenosylhomocysteine nucleosidase
MNTAFVAALEREVKPLVRHWRMSEREYAGRQYRFFEHEGAVLVCGGIGAEAARRATEAIIMLYSPTLVWSIGFAGALDSALKVGNCLQPDRVIDASDGSATEAAGGKGILVTYPLVAGAEQKAKLARAYGAQAVDMEAAAVARGAQARGIAFSAFKVISDESAFEMPALERFIENGTFRVFRFAGHVAIRPWLWARVIQLAKNSSRAAQALCSWLLRYNADPESLENKPTELHPMKRA